MRPILCNYYVTYRCNSNCKYCDIPQKSDIEKRADCSLEDVAQNLPYLKLAGVKFIDFTGGEPLLHPQLPLILKWAKEYGFYTSVTTNCRLYPQRSEELTGLIDLLHFSLDSMSERDNDRLRGSDSFSSVMKSIEIARNLGERPDLLFTVTCSNYKAINALSRFAAQEKLILIVNPLFVYSNQTPLCIEVLNYLDRFCQSPYVYINRSLHHFIRQGGNKREHPRCRAVSATVVISPQNELLLPCFHHAQFAFPIASNLVQILKSPMVSWLKKQQGTFSFCESCTINCYFDPSCFYKFDRYFWLNAISKFKYGYEKYLGRL